MADGIRKGIAFGALLLLGAIGFSLMVASPVGLAQDEDEDRPPIIVENGSVVVGPQYPSDSGQWGQWERQGSSPVWAYGHSLRSPTTLRTSVFNGQCAGAQPVPAWRRGPVRITYTDGSNTYTFDLLVTNGATILRTQPGDPTPTQDAATPWRLTFTGAYRLQRVEPAGGSTTDYCTFAQGSRPIIVVEQRR